MQGLVDPVSAQERKVKEALQGVGVWHNSGVIAPLANVQVSPGGIVRFGFPGSRWRRNQQNMGK